MTRLMFFLGLLWARQDVRRRVLLLAVAVLVILVSFSKELEAFAYCCRDSIWPDAICSIFWVC